MTALPFAKLMIDTARGPAALGERAATSAERQIVFRHGGIQLDVMLQSPAPPATFVWGQLCHSGSARPCAGALVEFVDAAARPLAASTTDAFGEFSFAAPRVDEGALVVDTGAVRFQCWIALRGGREGSSL